MKKVCIVISLFIVLLIVISVIFTMFQKNIPLTEKVAIVRIEGPIFDSGNVISEIKEYVKDPSVKALILRVDSPGGAVAPAQEIYEEVKKAVTKKKVVVSMGSVAASGGYYVSAPANRIIANPGTLTGSIGVIMEIPNIEGLMDKIGIKTEVIKTGRHKDMASVFRKLGKEERDILQGVLDDVHEQFIKAVSEARKMPIETARKLADGRVFTGRQAIDAGLVDELGNLEDAINIAAKLAGIKGEPHVVSKKEKFSIIDILKGKFPKQLTDIVPSVKVKYLFVP